MSGLAEAIAAKVAAAADDEGRAERIAKHQASLVPDPFFPAAAERRGCRPRLQRCTRSSEETRSHRPTSWRCGTSGCTWSPWQRVELVAKLGETMPPDGLVYFRLANWDEVGSVMGLPGIATSSSARAPTLIACSTRP